MKIKFVPEDCWIGLYWKSEFQQERDSQNPTDWLLLTTYYLCLVPCFPIIWKRYVNVPDVVVRGLPAYRNPTRTRECRHFPYSEVGKCRDGRGVFACDSCLYCWRGLEPEIT